MKKIIVTSATLFTGEIDIVYGELEQDLKRRFVSVDMKKALLPDNVLKRFMEVLPPFYGEGFEQVWGTDKLLFTEADVELDFYTDFYNPYKKKVNPDRCLPVWNKLQPSQKAAVVRGMWAYLAYLGRCSFARNKKDPEGFLKLKMYLTDWNNIND